MQTQRGLGFLADADKRAKVLEVVFIVAFSALVYAFFFSFLGANGVIVGNDPAVHLQTAENFLKVGRIQISDIAWYTPLYHITLDAFIAFTGATTIGQSMVLMRAFTALVDWLVVLSVYVVAAKFFGKRTAVLASALMLLCFPIFELNAWGGYTTILSLAFITLAIMYLTVPQKGIGNTLVAFVFAFSVVLSHQLATFLAAFIVPPFAVIMLIKSRGTNSRVIIAALMGGAIAFLIYYVRPILPYLGQLINILFFQLTVMKYQIGNVSFGTFVQSFGFILFFGAAGLAIAFFELRKRKALGFYLLLVLTLMVTLFFSQSYLFGIYLAYARFVYFLVPPLVIFAAVALSFVMDTVVATYCNNRRGWKRKFLKFTAVAIVVLLAIVMVVRFQMVSAGVGGVADYYSTSDVAAYQAGTWINQNFPDPAMKGVATEKPGNWLADYTGRTVFAQTDPLVDWNVNAECVLAMSYEFENPLTMTRVYEANSNTTDETYITVDMVWQKAVTSLLANSYFSFRNPDGTGESFPLSSLNRSVSMDERDYPPTISVQYSGPGFALTENIVAENDTYPVTINWQVSAVNRDLDYASLYLSEYLNPALNFNVANVPGALNWDSPIANPSKEDPGVWAYTNFYGENMTSDNRELDVYSNTTHSAFGLKFLTLPASGNVGSYWDGLIDSVRWEYDAWKVSANYTISISYQMLAFSMGMYPQLKDPHNMNSIFDLKDENSYLKSRNFAYIIISNYIGFLVYDKASFDPKIISSRWVQLVYMNDQYYVLKINSDHPVPRIMEPL